MVGAVGHNNGEMSHAPRPSPVRLLICSLAAVALTATGCSQARRATQPTPSDLAVPAPTMPAGTVDTPTPTLSEQTTSATPGPTTSATPSRTTSTAAVARCHTSQLAGSLGQAQGAAGSIITPILLTNRSGEPCTVTGYAGVSLVDAAGTQIGKPAARDGSGGAVVRLAPNATASFTIRTENPGVSNGEGCTQPSTKVKVFPPGELDPLFVTDRLQDCQNEFGITPLQAGASAGSG